MDADHSVFRRAEAGWSTAPDFRALVAFLAAAQATQPSAREAFRLSQRAEQVTGSVQALIAVFAPHPRQSFDGAALAGCFNPTVPIPNGPVTNWKAP